MQLWITAQTSTGRKCESVSVGADAFKHNNNNTIKIPALICPSGFLWLTRIRDVGLSTAVPVVPVNALPPGAPRVQQDPAALQAHSEQVAVETGNKQTHCRYRRRCHL